MSTYHETVKKGGEIIHCHDILGLGNNYEMLQETRSNAPHDVKVMLKYVDDMTQRRIPFVVTQEPNKTEGVKTYRFFVSGVEKHIKAREKDGL